MGDGGDSTARDLAARRRFHGAQRARAPGAPGADPGAGSGDERGRLVRRSSACRRSRSSVRCCCRSIRRSTSRSWRTLCGDGGGAIDADTYAVPGTYGAALRAAGGAVAAGRCPVGRRGGRGRERAAPARPSRRGGARDGVLLLRQRGRRRAARHGRARAVAGDDRRLGRASRQRDQRHLPRGRRRPVRLDPRVAAVPGDGAGSRRGVRGRRGLHREPAGAGRERGRRVPVAGRARRGVVDPRRGSRSSC